MTFSDPHLIRAQTALTAVMAGDVVDDHESEFLDFKEDVTMRGPGGRVTAGVARDEDAARYYALKAACLANHHGGALIIGVDDKRTGRDAVLGTGIDGPWLVRRIRELTGDPPLTVAIHEEHRAGACVLIVLIPRNGSAKPHSARESRNGARVYPRRVGKACHNMEYDELMSWHQGRTGYDWSAAPSGVPAAAARSAGVEALRDFLRESDEPSRRELAEVDAAALLSRLRLVDSDALNAAGALLLCAAPAARIRYLHRPGGSARSSSQVERAGLSLAEELARVIAAFEANNRLIELAGSGFAHGAVNALPGPAFREALINAVMHRDWERPEPIVVEHIGAEAVIFSPGGFFGGVTAATVLTAQPMTRNRLLGDTLRSLRLAEREGIGVDRMVIELVRLGHAPPAFVERDGGVRVTLAGGDPVPEVLRAHAALPKSLQDDARMSVAIDILRTRPSLTAVELAEAAQQPERDLTSLLLVAEREGALRRTASPRPDGSLAWRMGDDMRDALGPVLPYYARSGDESVALIVALARQQGTVRNRDVQDLLGASAPWASQLLSRAAEQGFIELGEGATGRGRSTFYVPRRTTDA